MGSNGMRCPTMTMMVNGEEVTIPVDMATCQDGGMQMLGENKRGTWRTVCIGVCWNRETPPTPPPWPNGCSVYVLSSPHW